MALRAKLVTPATFDFITSINGGLAPSDEALDDNTFYVYDDEVEIHHELLTRDEFHRRFEWTASGRNDNTIKKK